MSVMDYLGTYLIANTVVTEPKLIMNYKEMNARSEYLKLLKENIEKEEKEVKQ
jgi:hypothetical protein